LAAVTRERVLIISPVLNEAAHIRAVIRAMAAQTRPPDEWVVVDDGSTDGTREILAEAARDVPFLRVVSAPQMPLAAGADRLLHAAEAHAFNYGLGTGGDFTYVGKLDGDIELPPDYYAGLLERFRADASLGIAGGILTERSLGIWKVAGASDLQHVRGAVKLYSRECFEAIGGVREMLGWDGIDEVLARMTGYRTRSFPDVVAKHHRQVGSAQGRLRGHFRLGRCMYVEGYPAAWIAARSVKVAMSRPHVVSGLAYFAGYVRAATGRMPRFEADGYRQHLHRELRLRAGMRMQALLPR
jgi:glycosyltransferase involved in cell wall biosynthesis